MALIRTSLAAAILLSVTPHLFAQQSPAGLWVTFDAQTQKATSHIRVVESGDSLSGTVDQILDPAKAQARCEACEGDLKDQPLAGMQLFHDVKAKADEVPTWDGGQILDPKSGHFFKVRIRLLNNGNTLEVRGYRGTPMFGRTQLWQRFDEPKTASASPVPTAAP